LISTRVIRRSIESLINIHRQHDSDIKRRELGVYFKNLRVTGVGATASYQETVGSILNPKIIWRECRNALRPSTRTILHDFNGVVKPGEMLRELPFLSDPNTNTLMRIHSLQLS